MVPSTTRRARVEVSPTRIKTFGDCAQQYKYKYILELPGDRYSANTTLGSVFHYAIEVYEQYGNDLDLAIRTFRYYWNNVEDLDLRIDYYPRRTSHESLEQGGVDMLERYHSLAPWKTGELVGTEIRFTVPLGPHVLRGIIDKLFLRRGARELQVIDFKTGSYIPQKLRHNLQFTSYLYATTRPEFWWQVPGWEDFYERSRHFSRVGQWYHARNNKMYHAGGRGDLDYRRLRLAVDQMDLAIRDEVFPLTIAGEVCGWCPWVDICGTEVASPNSDLTNEKT